MSKPHQDAARHAEARTRATAQREAPGGGRPLPVAQVAAADALQSALIDAEADPAVAGLAVYVVGGAVRDALLGRPAGDRDWVVVGATPEQMAARGFTPVGGDFPVFLHPRTHEEYALARTERKSGRGYHGFVFHAGQAVTLEEDLRRRDLTVNAIAQAPDGTLVDPLGGVADVRARVLRHVGDAFVEDPVRLLRLARFAARFHDFSIAPETLTLCRQLVTSGEVDALVPERVWQEFAKGLMTAHPGRMLAVLAECGALARVAPGLVWDAEVAAGLQEGASPARGLDLAQRYALLCWKSAASLQDHLRVPTACRDLARLLPDVLQRLRRLSDAAVAPAIREAPAGAETAGIRVEDARAAPPAARPSCSHDLAEQQLDVFETCDALRRPERCLALLAAAQCLQPSIALDHWAQALQAVRGIDAGAIARAARGQPEEIRARLRVARLQVLGTLTPESSG
ncbi:tRNA CCA-pyrophosphorylase [Castellaniella caeni]